MNVQFTKFFLDKCDDLNRHIILRDYKEVLSQSNKGVGQTKHSIVLFDGVVCMS